MIKVDLHVHTSCSPDSLIPVERLFEICDTNGIDCVAVVDHDSIESALMLHEKDPKKIIVGEEIHTIYGEIIGLFLKEWIQPYLSPMDTIQKIKEQGGLVYIPHPFDGLRTSVLKKKILNDIVDQIDILEVFNSRNVFAWSNIRAGDFARENGIIAGVGSDAHSAYELGNAYVNIEPFDSALDFLSKLDKASLHTNKTPVLLNFVNKIYKVLRGIGK